MVLKDATRLISEQELVSLFKRTSIGPPAKLKQYKPPTVLGPFAQTAKQTNRPQTASDSIAATSIAATSAG